MSVTLTEAVRAFILADTTLAAKVGPNFVFPEVVPENMGNPTCAVIRCISGVNAMVLVGLSSQCHVRLEITFWGKSQHDVEVLANRLRKQSTGLDGSGGVTIKVFGATNPRGLYNPLNRFYGSQVDILATVDMDTAA